MRATHCVAPPVLPKSSHLARWPRRTRESCIAVQRQVSACAERLGLGQKKAIVSKHRVNTVLGSLFSVIAIGKIRSIPFNLFDREPVPMSPICFPHALNGRFSDGRLISAANQDFAALRGTQHGPVLLLASGPSASELCLEAWRDVPVITMNGAIAKLANSTIEPLFYVCSDLSFALQQPELYALGLERAQHLALWPEAIEGLSASLRLKAHALKRAPSTRLEHYLGVERHQAQRVYTLLSRRARNIGFSRNLDYGIFDVRTVAFIALQLAYHLGFTEIYLAGVDLNAQAPRFYERSTGLRSPCGLDEHLHSRILPGLRVMQVVMAAEGRRVFNLSRSSRIPARLIPLADLAAVEAAWLGLPGRQHRGDPMEHALAVDVDHPLSIFQA